MIATSPASDGQKPVAELFTDETAAIYIGGIEPRTIRASIGGERVRCVAGIKLKTTLEMD